MKNLRTLSAVSLAVLLTSAAVARDWPQFRGPFHNGSTDEKGLPEGWSTTENVAWTADLPGPSAATPVVSGDRVFVSSTNTEKSSLDALCLNRKDGKILWQKTVSEGIQRDRRSNYASNTPAANDELVVFFYGNGAIATFDHSGKELWKRSIAKDYGEFAFLWTYSTSPLLFDGKLYLQVLQRDVPVDGRGRRGDSGKIDSYLLALDPKTGKELWRRVRPSKARAESREAFTTPVPFRSGGKSSILVVGGDALTAHDASNGKELWRWGTWNPTRIGHWRHVPSPVASEDIVLVCAPKRDPIYAIKVDGAKGTLGEDAVAWVSRDQRPLSADVPTPAFYDGDFFVLSDVRKSLSRVEPRTGKAKWTTRLPGDSKFEASPLAADGKLYVVSQAGVVVIASATNGNVLREIDMKSTKEYLVRSSVIASNGQLFVRTNRKLYCIGE